MLVNIEGFRIGGLMLDCEFWATRLPMVRENIFYAMRGRKCSRVVVTEIHSGDKWEILDLNEVPELLETLENAHFPSKLACLKFKPRAGAF